MRLRKLFIYDPVDPKTFLEKLIAFSKKESYFSLLCSGGNISNQSVSNNHEWIAALGAIEIIQPQKNSFEELKSLHDKTNDWLFGYLSYDLKNEIESLSSENEDGLGFPSIQFTEVMAG